MVTAALVVSVVMQAMPVTVVVARMVSRRIRMARQAGLAVLGGWLARAVAVALRVLVAVEAAPDSRVVVVWQRPAAVTVGSAAMDGTAITVRSPAVEAGPAEMPAQQVPAGRVAGAAMAPLVVRVRRV
jgi:hypothetical protein